MVSEKGLEVGMDVARRANKRGRSKAKREVLKEGDLVVRAFMRKRSKFAEKYEGPFRIKEFNSDLGGYKLEDMDGKLVKNWVPIEHLKVVDEAFKEAEVSYEIEEVVSHQGRGEKILYEVKWKGLDKTTWEPVRYFKESSLDPLKVYWGSKKKESQ